MENLICQLRNTIKYPLLNGFPFFLYLLLIFSFDPLLGGFMGGFWGYCFYRTCLFVIVSFLITLLCVHQNTACKIVASVVSGLLLILSVTATCGQIYFSLLSPYEVFSIIAQTNHNEVNEFIAFFFSWKIILLIFLVILVHSLFLRHYIWNKDTIKLPRYLSLSIIGIVLASIIATIYNQSFFSGFISEIKSLTEEGSIDIRQYEIKPHLSEVTAKHPSVICILIGETFTKYHSSIYGYNKITNPKLQKLVDSDNLIAMNNVLSPKNTTAPCFEYILNTHQLADKGEWYKSINIQRCYRDLGYHTIWFSNQEQYGIYANLPTDNAELCDERHFVSSTLDKKDSYDMDLVKAFRSTKINHSNNLLFFHLMGQHINYEQRYPIGFGVFADKDYSDKPENHRHTLATYDNATLYNDSVVSSLISLVNNKDALVVYFPDHGEDIYYVDDYCGHGRENNEKSSYFGRQIPFFVYISDEFKQNHPQLVNVIKSNRNKPFCTDTFIYKLLSWTGFKLAH